MVKYPGRHDACWNDTAWRTTTFQQVVSENNLTLDMVSKLLDRDYNVVRHWHSGKYKQIPRAMLRLLILELRFDATGRG